MTYLQNRLIEDTDFNSFSNTLNGFWSTGTGNSGYGQPQVPTVANDQVVIATGYWRTLTDNITSMANHTGSLIASMTPQPTTNGKITYLQNISTNLVTINNNRLNAASQGSTTTSTVTSSSTWNDKMIMTFSVEFETSSAARYFFNAGGQLGLSFSHPATGGINTLVSDLCSEAGTIWLSSPTSGTVSLAGTNYSGVTKVGGVVSARSTVNTNFGYYALTSTDVQILNQTSDFSPVYYQNSFLRIYARAIDTGFLGSRRKIIFTCLFEEVPDGDLVTAGTIGTLTVRPPSLTHLPVQSWGTPTVTTDVTYSTVVTSIYSTPGAYAYVVPSGTTAVIITYPNIAGTNGISTTTVSVTPGQTITVTVGNYGSGSSFGGFVTMPVFSVPVLTFSGNVDHTLYVTQTVLGATTANYAGSGSSGTLTAGAAAAGISYSESSEGYHGDLTASISIKKLSTSYVLYGFRAAFSQASGRGSVSITAQPTFSNGYVLQTYVFDPFGSEGYYLYEVVIQQIVGMSITTVN